MTDRVYRGELYRECGASCGGKHRDCGGGSIGGSESMGRLGTTGRYGSGSNSVAKAAGWLKKRNVRSHPFLVVVGARTGPYRYRNSLAWPLMFFSCKIYFFIIEEIRFPSY